MADDDDQLDIDDPNDEVAEDAEVAEVAEAAYELVALRGAGRVLQWVAIVAAIVCVVALATNFWIAWDRTRGDMGGLTGGSVDNNRLLDILSMVFINASTWGWALVAVLAFGGATLVRGQRLRLLIAAIDDD